MSLQLIVPSVDASAILMGGLPTPIGYLARTKSTNRACQPNQPILPLPLFPPEVLNLISSNLNQHSATQFALTCRRFVLFAERPIWRTISMDINSHSELYPRINSLYSSGHDAASSSARQENQAARREYAAAAYSKLRTILNRSNERRIEMVERLDIGSRLETNPALIGLLGQCAPNLRRLSMFCHEMTELDPHLPILEREIFTWRISFPSLTHFRIVHEAVSFSEDIAYLTNSAPNLVSLDINLTKSVMSRSDSYIEGRPPSLNTLHKLRYLRYETSTDTFATLSRAIVRLISSSPELRQAAIRIPGGNLSPINAKCWTALSTRLKLHDLQFSMNCKDFMSCFEAKRDSDNIFPQLQRLVLSTSATKETAFVNLYDRLPSLPALAMLYINHSPTKNLHTPSYNLPTPFKTHRRMMTSFAASLRLSQHLHTIHLTENYNIFGNSEEFPMKGSDKEEPGVPSGTIRSFKSKSDEGGGGLLLARILTRYLEVSDTARNTIPFESGVACQKVVYFDNQGKPREMVFEEHSRDTWRNFTDYKGLEVPLWVITQMEVAEGFTFSKRQGRGIRLGDQGERILMDWYNETRNDIVKKRKEGMTPRMAEWGYEGYAITGC